MVPHMRGHMMSYRPDRRDAILAAAATLAGVVAAAVICTVAILWT